MSEEKELTNDEIVKALEMNCLCVVYGTENCESCLLFEKDCSILPNAVVDLIHRLQAENERLKINLANEKKWGKIQTKQAEKETARKIFGELDLFFKGTTFRQGYEFKKINEKLKEMAKNHGVEVDYEN